MNPPTLNLTLIALLITPSASANCNLLFQKPKPRDSIELTEEMRRELRKAHRVYIRESLERVKHEIEIDPRSIELLEEIPFGRKTLKVITPLGFGGEGVSYLVRDSKGKRFVAKVFFTSELNEDVEQHHRDTLGERFLDKKGNVILIEYVEGFPIPIAADASALEELGANFTIAFEIEILVKETGANSIRSDFILEISTGEIGPS